jgi:hypothetical protein
MTGAQVAAMPVRFRPYNLLTYVNVGITATFKVAAKMQVNICGNKRVHYETQVGQPSLGGSSVAVACRTALPYWTTILN